MSANKFFHILGQSGVHSGTCLIGEGATKRDAIEDAYGPGSRKIPSHHFVKEFGSQDEADASREGSQGEW